MKKILLSCCIILASGCSIDRTVIMKHPDTGETRECKHDSKKTYIWEAEKGIQKCIIDYESLGYEEQGNPEKEARRIFVKTMNDAIGKMSYDDALRFWGPPIAAEGTEIIVATWSHEGRGALVIPPPPSATSFKGWATVVPISHGDELKLIFDKQNKKLKEWYYKNW